MRERACVAMVALLVVLGGGIGLAADWWEEEQTSLVQASQGKDVEGNPTGALVNWEDGYVKATGTGTADIRTAVNSAQALALAQDAARVRAYAQLAEVVKGFNITSDITVRDGLVENSEQTLRLEAFIKGARVLTDQTKIEWLPDGAPMVTITVGLVMGAKHPGVSAAAPAPIKPTDKPRNLNQAMSATIREVEETSRKERQIEVYIPAPDAPLPEERGLDLGIRPIIEEKPAEPPPVAPPTTTTAPAVVAPVVETPPEAPKIVEQQVWEFPEGTEEKDYSGVIIDARGLNGSPSLSPKIFSEYGKEVWGTLEVDLDYAMNYGVADFAHDMVSAKGKERAGSAPLVLTAMRVQGAEPESVFNSDFMVSEKAANLILKMNDRMKAKDKDGKGFLEKCCVVFIL